VAKKHWLWRAVDQDGFVLDVLVQSRRNAKAAKRLMRKLLKGQGRALRVMVTDKLRSYDAAKREIMPGVEHRSHKGLNNRAENPHQPIRRRERIMKRFKSRQHLQHFVSSHDPIANLFHIPRHDISSGHHRELRSAAMTLWRKSPERDRQTRPASWSVPVAVKFTMPVGRLVALLADEAFEQEIIGFRIDRGDAEHATDGGTGSRSAALAKDALRSGVADDRVHRQKIGGIFHRLDESELVTDAFFDVGRQTFGIAGLHASQV
jgi:IS1 family transposase